MTRIFVTEFIDGLRAVSPILLGTDFKKDDAGATPFGMKVLVWVYHRWIIVSYGVTFGLITFSDGAPHFGVPGVVLLTFAFMTTLIVPVCVLMPLLSAMIHTYEIYRKQKLTV